MSYSPCTECQRHLRNTERSCPFCGQGVPSGRVRPGAPRGLKRAALVALGTSLSAAACGSDERSPSADVGQQQSNVPEATATGADGPGGNSNNGNSNGSSSNGSSSNGSGGDNADDGEGSGGAEMQPTAVPPTNVQPGPTMDGPMASITPTPEPDVITVPVYGAPVAPSDLPVGMAGAGGATGVGGSASTGGATGIGGSVNAGGVGGEAAEADAGAKEDAGLVEPEGQGGDFQGQGGFQVQPLYGAVPLPIE